MAQHSIVLNMGPPRLHTYTPGGTQSYAGVIGVYSTIIFDKKFAFSTIQIQGFQAWWNAI